MKRALSVIRESAIIYLGDRRLKNLAVDLGIFDARDYEREKLEMKFIRSRLFSDETMLHFLTLAELRSTAEKLDIPTSRVSKSSLIAKLLAFRRTHAVNQRRKNIADAAGDNKHLSEGRAFSIDATSVGEAPEAGITNSFNFASVPKELLRCTHTRLFQRSDGKWVLASKRGTIFSVFRSMDAGKKWLIAFDEFRGFEHKQPSLSPPTGRRKRQRGKKTTCYKDDYGYKQGRGLCPVCFGGVGGGNCYKCGGTGFA
jgi:hypothetical protein